MFADAEFQRLLRSMPDYFIMREYTIGQLLNTIFFSDAETPQTNTVNWTTPTTYSDADPFAGELTESNSDTGTPVHRPIFLGAGAIKEYFQDLNQLISEAGIQGKVGEGRISNNGVEIMTDRIQFLLRPPQNRTQDMVAVTYQFYGDWTCRTDSATGDKARYKRVVVVEHSE